MEQIINRIMSLLDSSDILYQDRSWAHKVQSHLNITDDEVKNIYDCIPKNDIVMDNHFRERIGELERISNSNIRYVFRARYRIYRDRTSADEELEVLRHKPNEKYGEWFALYSKSLEAQSVEGDAQTLAKTILSRLNEDTNDSIDMWKLGGSLEAIAKACYERIPKQEYDDCGHTDASKGSLSIIGEDGLEYLFIATDFSDWGGSESYYSGALTIECSIKSMKRKIYSYGYHVR